MSTIIRVGCSAELWNIRIVVIGLTISTFSVRCTKEFKNIYDIIKNISSSLETAIDVIGS